HDPRAYVPEHPDTPERLLVLEQALAREGWLGWERREAPPASETQLQLVPQRAPPRADRSARRGRADAMRRARAAVDIAGRRIHWPLLVVVSRTVGCVSRGLRRSRDWPRGTGGESRVPHLRLAAGTRALRTRYLKLRHAEL